MGEKLGKVQPCSFREEKVPVPGQDLTQAVCTVCTTEKFIVTSTGNTLSNSFFLFFFFSEHQKATLTATAEKPPVSNYQEQ